MIGIYKITNKLNNKIYIGQSNNIKRRFVEHKNLNHEKCPSLLAAFKKYGIEQFSFEVLEECEIDKLNECEMFYIELLKPQYNRTKGGKGARGHFMSDDVKKILSEKGKKQWEAKTEEEKRLFVKNNLKGPAYGHPVSDKVRETMHNRYLGVKQPQSMIDKRCETMRKKKLAGWKRPSCGTKKVLCIETNVVFESVKAVGMFLNIPSTRVSQVLCGKRKGGTLHGFHFVYLGSVETNPDECKGVGKKKWELLEVQDNNIIIVEEIVQPTKMINLWNNV